MKRGGGLQTDEFCPLVSGCFLSDQRQSFLGLWGGFFGGGVDCLFLWGFFMLLFFVVILFCFF